MEMQTQRTRAKIEENLSLVCKFIGLDQQSSDSDTQNKIRVIYSALAWTAEDVFKQCTGIEIPVIGVERSNPDFKVVQHTRGRSYVVRDGDTAPVAKGRI